MLSPTCRLTDLRDSKHVQICVCVYVCVSDLHSSLGLTFGLDDLSDFFAVFNNSMIPCNSRVFAIMAWFSSCAFFQHECIFRRDKVMGIEMKLLDRITAPCIS